ncbi:hypothetical protein E3N88_01570 [Mikania micrantha]|uniref:Uncharacterized protein n=1 Tax=Mikania micrantha TaxID=192012 RepID=A0A5N6Q1B6_9ASTR|nr:hypothetical protein E3N88_01570 [Mikania micrantha]
MKMAEPEIGGDVNANPPNRQQYLKSTGNWSLNSSIRSNRYEIRMSAAVMKLVAVGVEVELAEQGVVVLCELIVEAGCEGTWVGWAMGMVFANGGGDWEVKGEEFDWAESGGLG